MSRYWVFGLFLVLACEERQPAPSEAVEPVPSPPFEIADVIRRVRLAFREEGDRLEADTGSWRASVDARGQLGFGPSDGSATLQLRTRRIARGATRLDRSPALRLTPEHQVELSRGGATERLTSGDEGLEQSWLFAEPPSGEGPLVVEVEVKGVPFEGASAAGLHFRGERGQLLRYSHATWIDASGERTPLEAKLVAGAIRLAVPEDVLARSSFPAVLDPTVSVELGTDVVVSSPGPVTQGYPSLSSDGTNYFLAWAERRGGYDVWGARVSAAGTVLDAAGIPIGPSELNTPSSTAVAFNGSSYLVAWVPGQPPLSSTGVRAARVSAAGAVLDATPLVVTTQQYTEEVAVASGNGDFLVVFDASGIKGRRVSGAGALLDSAPFAISSANVGAPGVAFNGGQYLVTFGGTLSGADLQGAFVSTSGTVGAPFTICNATGTQMDSTAVATSTGFFVAWTDNRNYSSSNIYGTAVSTSGVPSNPSGIAYTDYASPFRAPRLAFNGTNVLLTYINGTSSSASYIYATLLNPSGTVLAGRTIIKNPAGYAGHASAALGSSFLTVFQSEYDASTGPSRLYGNRIDSSGTPLNGSGLGAAGYRLMSLGNQQQAASISFDGTNYLVVWEDTPSGIKSIRGARVTRAGTVLDTSGLAISPAGQTGVSTPATGGNSSGHLVIWLRDLSTDEVWSAKVGTSGAVSQRQMIATGSAYSPRVSGASSDFLAVWAPSNSNIQGARLSSTGALLSPAGGFAITGFGASAPAVASNGTDWLVTWISSANVQGTRISAAGALLDSPPLDISSLSVSENSPSVAYGAGHYQLVWSDQSSSRILGRRVTATGSFLDSAPVTVGNAGIVPSIAYDGSKFLAVWTLYSGSEYDVVGSVISSAGVSQSLSPFSISSNPGPELRPTVAGDGAGGFLVGYHRFIQGGGANVDRVRLRTISATGSLLGVACTSDTQCLSGRCVDGVCCNELCSNACQACSTSRGAAQSGTCGLRPSGTVCRAAVGPCDAPESCTGSSGACPGDALRNSSSVCRPSDAGCDAPEYCTGSDAGCPPDGLRPAGYACRAALSPCDVTDHCTGSSRACPADRLQDAGVLCRAAVSACDVEERCTGVDAGCPSDQVMPVGTVCRAAVSSCDYVETCTGTAQCPIDAVVPAGTPTPLAGPCDIEDLCNGTAQGPGDSVQPAGVQCRPAAGACDLAELCDGVTASCPNDVLRPSGTECHPSAGPCDPAEACDGASPECPPDLLSTAGTVCRAAEGSCDMAETCSGGSAECPQDVLLTAGTLCRAPVGACDAPDRCPGDSPQCPADALLPPGSVCREAIGGCDLVELCSGSSTECPADLSAPDGTACDDQNACTTSDSCSAGACNGSSPRSCQSNDPCLAPGACDPSSGGCGQPVPRPDGTSCPGGTCQAGLCVAADAPTPAGCGCGSAGAAPLAWVLSLGLLGWGAGRRRRAGGLD